MTQTKLLKLPKTNSMLVYCNFNLLIGKLNGKPSSKCWNKRHTHTHKSKASKYTAFIDVNIYAWERRKENKILEIGNGKSECVLCSQSLVLIDPRAPPNNKRPTIQGMRTKEMTTENTNEWFQIIRRIDGIPIADFKRPYKWQRIFYSLVWDTIPMFLSFILSLSLSPIFFLLCIGHPTLHSTRFVSLHK